MAAVTLLLTMFVVNPVRAVDPPGGGEADCPAGTVLRINLDAGGLTLAGFEFEVVDNGAGEVLLVSNNTTTDVTIVVKGGSGVNDGGDGTPVLVAAGAQDVQVHAPLNPNSGKWFGVSNVSICDGPGGDGDGDGDGDDEASLNILKFVEGTRTRLPGAVFEIEGMNGTFTTDENGQICITGLPDDSEWLVREIQAPAGYEIIDAEQMVEVDDDGDCDSPDARFYNRPASAPTPTPTPGQGGQEATPTPTPAGQQGGSTPTPRENVAGGNPTPAPSGGELPDTAMGSFGQVPATVLSLVLLGALAAMVYARLARQR